MHKKLISKLLTTVADYTDNCYVMASLYLSVSSTAACKYLSCCMLSYVGNAPPSVESISDINYKKKKSETHILNVLCPFKPAKTKVTFSLLSGFWESR